MRIRGYVQKDRVCLLPVSNHVFLGYQVLLIKAGNVVAPYKFERVRAYVPITRFERICVSQRCHKSVVSSYYVTFDSLI